MAQYIEKSALVAKIERLISNGQVKLRESQESNDYENYVAWAEHIATCIKVLSIIDTLEVKEVDLEKEFYNYIEKQNAFTNNDNSEIKYYNGDSFNHVYDIYPIAKHFYELGISLKAQKEFKKESETNCPNFDEAQGTSFIKTK